MKLGSIFTPDQRASLQRSTLRLRIFPSVYRRALAMADIRGGSVRKRHHELAAKEMKLTLADVEAIAEGERAPTFANLEVLARRADACLVDMLKAVKADGCDLNDEADSEALAKCGCKRHIAKKEARVSDGRRVEVQPSEIDSRVSDERGADRGAPGRNEGLRQPAPAERASKARTTPPVPVRAAAVKKRVSMSVKIVKVDEQKRLVYGAVYAPLELDTHGDWTDAARSRWRRTSISRSSVRR
jgi:hypothetical protein